MLICWHAWTTDQDLFRVSFTRSTNSTGLCEDLANESDKRKCWTRDFGTWLSIARRISTWLNHVPALPLVALVCKIFAKSSIQGCKRKNTCMMRRFSLIIREKGRRIWLRMRNTNNGQFSDFTDFVRAVTRNRDTTWRGLMAHVAIWVGLSSIMAHVAIWVGLSLMMAHDWLCCCMVHWQCLFQFALPLWVSTMVDQTS